MVLKEKLWKLRLEKKLTISQLSEQTKIQEERLQAFEDGRMLPNIIDTAKLENFYKVTASYLIGDTALETKPLPAIFYKSETDEFAAQMTNFDILCNRLCSSERDLLIIYLNNCIFHFLYTEDGESRSHYEERSRLFLDCLKQHIDSSNKKQESSYYVQSNKTASCFFSDTCDFLDRMMENDYS